MISILVASISHYSGKGLVCLGVGLKFKQDGLRVGYFKPLGPLPMRIDGIQTDEDAAFFKKALGLDDSLESICPVVLTEQIMAATFQSQEMAVKRRLLDGFSEVSKEKDIVLAAGLGRLSSGMMFGFSEYDFAMETNSKVIAIDRSQFIHETVDGFLHLSDRLGDNLLGVILNRIPRTQMDYMKGAIVPFLQSRGIEVLGVIPEDRILGAVSVGELVDELNGRVLCCEDKLDELVEAFSIGAMNVESALKHFRKVTNKAVITGGDRADIQLTALETSTKCMLLTGDLYPNDIIIARAQEKGVPLVVVRSDTADTIERCERLSGHLSLHSEAKIQHAADVVEREIDFPKLYDKLGIEQPRKS